MRRNHFGDAYCHTAEEALDIIGEHENGFEVYAGSVTPPEGKFGAAAEIVDNVSGETVCYVEAPSEADVRAILKELRLD